MSNNWIDPVDEATKQFFRDNPEKALVIRGVSILVVGGILLLALCYDAIAKALGLQ